MSKDNIRLVIILVSIAAATFIMYHGREGWGYFIAIAIITLVG